MSIEVEGPDGAVIEFPDGTDQATMTTALQKHYGAPQQPSVAADVAKSGGSGLVRGVLGAATLPFEAAHLATVGAAKLGNMARGALGYDPLPIPSDPTVDYIRPAEKVVTDQLHEPQTTAGKYAETIGEFAPSALVGPGGVARKIAETVIPAVGSEAAGEYGGPWARIAAGLGLGGGVAAATSRVGTADRLLARSVQGQDASVFQLAQALQDRASALGVPLSGAEAVQQVTGGATKLGDTLRVIEGSTNGGAVTAPFFAQRPQQVRDATGRVLDQIAPAPAAPSTIGPQAAEAAQGGIDAVRRDINTQTAPQYAAIPGQAVPAPAFAPIAQDPAFQASLKRLRDDPVLGPTYANMTDNNVAVIDAVTKDMRAQGQALGTVTNPGFQPQKAAMFDTGAADARAIASDPARGGSAEYGQALAIQAQRRGAELDPLEQGPLGRIAAATDTRGATTALLPSNPLAGSRDEVMDAALRLVGQDPAVVPALVRQHIADAADVAGRDLQSGPAQYAGANLAKAVGGTAQQRDNLAAVMDAAGVQSDLPALLDVFRATGMRKQPGSATEFNRQISTDLAGTSLPVEVGKAAVTGGFSLPSLFSRIAEAGKTAALNRNAAEVASSLIAPDSATQLGAVAARGAENPLLALFGRSALQLPAEIR